MLHQLKNGSCTVQELYAQCANRVQVIKSLNAYIRVTDEVSQVQLQESTTRYLKGTTRLMEGIPIAIKDNFCTKNITTTCASKMLENFVPTYNATVVERLLDSGAILMGKTNLDEFGMGSGTTESIFGPTKNIWGSNLISKANDIDNKVSGSQSDDFFIAGGSSGGSAVAVAAGSCSVALGSDTGGSVRNPASYCGVVGFKPSYGSISRYGLIPLVNSMDVPGILARTIGDCRSVFEVIKGCDPKDSTTLQRTLNKSKTKRSSSKFDKLCVGIPKEFYCPGLSSEVIDAWKDVADLLENSGFRVIQVSLPHTSYSIACYSVLNPCEVASNMARYDGLRYGYRATGKDLNSTESLYAANRSHALNQIVRGRILAGNYFLLKENYDKYFVQALKLRRLIYDDYVKMWSTGVDILLTPVTLSDAPLFSEFTEKDSRAQSADQDYCTQPANMAGIPALSLPVRLSKRNLPLSLQLMAPHFDDETLLDVAHLLEKELNFPHPTVKVA
ncbi:hypothetical protein DAPPUDRAFT_188353 [Daphnia pulex]|uniref:Glutamyl-tRNA(Gln) amidotransferase subunit A, mitochondrial n=1 Tax=Daphnia pulex TaxID=6669 RepID=E9GN84_DAPPU|nr:hypothetical protein DAPPUDRAFT_188353 [Daphnia pulex]|eukprot:EFX78989.1 hypothetical protein DAPPUDRAFT_188353 [Daphnia pulex]